MSFLSALCCVSNLISRGGFLIRVLVAFGFIALIVLVHVIVAVDLYTSSLSDKVRFLLPALVAALAHFSTLRICFAMPLGMRIMASATLAFCGFAVTMLICLNRFGS